MLCTNKECPVKVTVGSFCCKCGTQLAPDIECDQCHDKLLPSDKFCRWCGKIVDKTLDKG